MIVRGQTSVLCLHEWSHLHVIVDWNTVTDVLWERNQYSPFNTGEDALSGVNTVHGETLWQVLLNYLKKQHTYCSVAQLKGPMTQQGSIHTFMFYFYFSGYSAARRWVRSSKAVLSRWVLILKCWEASAAISEGLPSSRPHFLLQISNLNQFRIFMLFESANI